MVLDLQPVFPTHFPYLIMQAHSSCKKMRHAGTPTHPNPAPKSLNTLPVINKPSHGPAPLHSSLGKGKKDQVWRVLTQARWQMRSPCLVFGPLYINKTHCDGVLSSLGSLVDFSWSNSCLSPSLHVTELTRNLLLFIGFAKWNLV